MKKTLTLAIGTAIIIIIGASPARSDAIEDMSASLGQLETVASTAVRVAGAVLAFIAAASILSTISTILKR